MEIRQLLQAHCLFILTLFISAQYEVIIDNDKKNIYTSPGSDENLTCTICKGENVHITQTQWSKFVDGKLERLAVYNPLYGTTHFRSLEITSRFKKIAHCDQSDSSRTYSQRDCNVECNQWILHLRNVSLEWAGVYECSFATFPVGIKSSEIHLIIKKDDEKSSVVEILLNRTLEIPCFKDKPSANLEKAPLTWLMEEDGTEEILGTKQYYSQLSYVTNATRYKERMQMQADNTLKISPVLVVDDGKKFICSVAEHPGRTLKSITEVKVFVKPEIAIYSSPTGKQGSLTCVVRKAFPMPDLKWYVDGMILNNKSEGIFVENESTTDPYGFYELRSRLTRWGTTPPSPQTFKCMSLYPFPGNQTRNVSAEEIVLPAAGFQTPPFLDLISQVVPVSSSSTEQFKATSSPSLEFISQTASISVSPTERFQMMSSVSLETSTQVTSVSDFPTEKLSHSPKSFPDEASTTLSSYSTVPQSTPSTRRVSEFITLSSHGNSSKGFVNLSGNTITEHTKLSWPAIVSAMLLVCTVLIILAIRKWCHYQKEIMNRPPSFKPPPPPIKYTPIHDTDGIYPNCNELENL